MILQAGRCENNDSEITTGNGWTVEQTNYAGKHDGHVYHRNVMGFQVFSLSQFWDAGHGSLWSKIMMIVQY